MGTLEQIVAENAVLRETIAQCLLKCIYIVDPLADIRAFPEEVLIHVGDGTGIRINARLSGEKSGKPRPAGTGQTHAHTRLENAVALDDPSEFRIEPRAVERVGQRAGEFAGRVTRQLRIRVERDDESDGGQDLGLADDNAEPISCPAPQK